MASPHDALSLEDRPAEDRPALEPVRPQRDAFHLPALDASVATARRRLVERLRAWRVDEDCCSDAELLISELFTNAVRHTDSRKIGCEVWCIGRRLRLEVTDQGGGAEPFPPPGDGALDTDGENGRGLLLVSVLALEWGIRTGDRGEQPGSGHAVWAELACSRSADP